MIIYTLVDICQSFSLQYFPYPFDTKLFLHSENVCIEYNFNLRIIFKKNCGYIIHLRKSIGLLKFVSEYFAFNLREYFTFIIEES